MTHTGILVPADETQPHRLVTWETAPDGSGLLDLLYREVGDLLDATTVLPGRVRLWCQDDGLLAAEPDYNDRALALCRALGYPAPALAGPVVFIGAVQGEDEAGLSPELLAMLDGGLHRMQELINELVDD